MDQQTIITEMKVLPEIDVQFEIDRRITFIKNQLIKSGFNNLVLGISGGVDSSTCGRLAQMAVNELNNELQDGANTSQYKFIAVRLPYGIQADEEDAQQALDFIQPSHCLTTNVLNGADGVHHEVLQAMSKAQILTADDAQIDFSKGNLKARTRMISQYHIAGILGALVIGTDHSAENVTGFFYQVG
jgi:NAD+ synthase